MFTLKKADKMKIKQKHAIQAKLKKCCYVRILGIFIYYLQSETNYYCVLSSHYRMLLIQGLLI